jgi:hypothetical protein
MKDKYIVAGESMIFHAFIWKLNTKNKETYQLNKG